MASRREAVAQALLAVAAMLLACPARCAAELDVDMTQTGPGTVERIADIEAFENTILKSDAVWVVVFTSTSTDPVKSRGVNREKCDEISSQIVNAAVELNAVHVKVGLVDIDDLTAIASEFNVRKRMLPVPMLFKTRARDADKLKTDLFATPSELKAQVVELLGENPQFNGVYQKITLTLGGGEL